MKESTTYSPTEYIPMAAWSKVHWSTLVYMETVMVDCAGFQIGADAHMRSNRRNLRVMAQQCAKPRRAAAKSASLAVAMLPEHGTRLANGQVLDGRDDWNCIQDMANESLFTCTADDVEPGQVLHLSERGQQLCNALRAHKAAGGNFSDFRPQVEA